jgi:GNAT superfamily N-acetyltransferase
LVSPDETLSEILLERLLPAGKQLAACSSGYDDDVWRAHPGPSDGWSLVAVVDGEVVALSGASPAPHGATIDTIAVHPDRRRNGLGSALVEELIRRLQRGEVSQVDAWTRDDPDTLAWCQACGFDVRYRYLHVFAEGETEMNAAATVSPGLIPRSGLFHADTQDPTVEAELRQRFRRVHACHRFVRDL